MSTIDHQVPVALREITRADFTIEQVREALVDLISKGSTRDGIQAALRTLRNEAIAADDDDAEERALDALAIIEGAVRGDLRIPLEEDPRPAAAVILTSADEDHAKPLQTLLAELVGGRVETVSAEDLDGTIPRLTILESTNARPALWMRAGHLAALGAPMIVLTQGLPASVPNSFDHVVPYSLRFDQVDLLRAQLRRHLREMGLSPNDLDDDANEVGLAETFAEVFEQSERMNAISQDLIDATDEYTVGLDKQSKAMDRLQGDPKMALKLRSVVTTSRSLFKAYAEAEERSYEQFTDAWSRMLTAVRRMVDSPATLNSIEDLTGLLSSTEELAEIFATTALQVDGQAQSAENMDLREMDPKLHGLAQRVGRNSREIAAAFASARNDLLFLAEQLRDKIAGAEA